MAVFDFIPVIGSGNGGVNTVYAANLTAASTSGVITVGNDQIIRIAAVNPISIRFGTSVNVSTATANDILLPGGVGLFDMGHQNNAIVIYANSTTLVTVSIVQRN